MRYHEGVALGWENYPMNGLLRVAVCASAPNWREQFCQALETKRAAGYPLSCDVVDLDRHDWMEVVRPYHLVIWKPGYMGLSGTAIFKEKTFFMERHLGKLVVPNFNSIWHFESKIAQSYLFALDEVPTPRTTACFALEDARRQLAAETLPLVFKRSQGRPASTSGWSAARARPNRPCARPSAPAVRRGPQQRRLAAIHLAAAPGKALVLDAALGPVRGKGAAGQRLLAEFLADNPADMKIIAIGDRYAYGFWRNDRIGDFRASGGGRIDLARPIPAKVLDCCLKLNQRWDVDSMGYDVLLKDGKPVIIEMSYGYYDTVPWKSAGYYQRRADGALNGRRTHLAGTALGGVGAAPRQQKGLPGN